MSQLVDITLPAEQREGTQVTLQQWLVAVGDTVAADQPIAELETDKVTMEIYAPQQGVVQDILVNPGGDVEPDTVLGHIAPAATATATTIAPITASTETHTSRKAHSAENTVDGHIDNNDSARHLIGPAVRRLLREHQLDIALIPGSGRSGRVTRDDVMAYLENPKPRTSGSGSTFIPHTPMRKSIAKHMVESLLHTAPHVTSVFEMDMSNIIEHRRWHKKEYREKDVNLTFTAYFLAASAKAIAQVPSINARFHQDALEVFSDINIGVGTALGDGGLIVPVVNKVQNRDLFHIAQALQEQTHKARAGKLTPADLKHGTFTISNHGVSGSLLATPIIINQPQVAILGVGKLQKRAVVIENQGKDSIEIKPMCYVSLTVDHRAVDAFQTNQFLSVFVDTIEGWGE